MPNTTQDTEPGDDEIEQRVDAILENAEKLLASARIQPLSVVESFIDRLRVEIIIKRPERPRRDAYRALIDYFDDVAAARAKKSGVASQGQSPGMKRFLRQLLQGLEME